MSKRQIHLRDIAYARSGDKGSGATLCIIAYTAEGYEYLREHLTAEALEVFETWAMGRPDLSRWQVAQTHYRLGRYEEAIPLLREELGDTSGIYRLPPGALLAISLHQVGDWAGADSVEVDLTYPAGNANWRRQWLALAAAGRGDLDRALRLLVDAFADGVPYYPGGEDFFHFRPEFEELRQDPRFQQLAEPRSN